MKLQYYISVISIALTLGVAAQATAYVKVPIPDEMSIQVPKNWIVIGDDFTTTIEAWAEALDEEDAPLLASALTVRSPLSQGYATLSIRIDRGKCPSQEDLKELPDATAVVLMEQNRVQMAKGFAQAGVAFTHWKTEKAVLSNGFQTIKNSYIRTAPNNEGAVIVNQYFIPMGDRVLWLTASLRQSEKIIWEPILKKMCGSLAGARPEDARNGDLEDKVPQDDSDYSFEDFLAETSEEELEELEREGLRNANERGMAHFRNKLREQARQRQQPAPKIAPQNQEDEATRDLERHSDYAQKMWERLNGPKTP